MAPAVIEHGIVGMAGGVGRDGLGAAILMRDLSAALATQGDVPFSERQHDDFIDHLATMCAATWGWHDDIGLMPYGARWEFFGHAAIEGDRAAVQVFPLRDGKLVDRHAFHLENVAGQDPATIQSCHQPSAL